MAITSYKPKIQVHVFDLSWGIFNKSSSIIHFVVHSDSDRIYSAILASDGHHHDHKIFQSFTPSVTVFCSADFQSITETESFLQKYQNSDTKYTKTILVYKIVIHMIVYFIMIIITCHEPDLEHLDLQ